MTHSNSGSAAHNHPHDEFILFDLTEPFDAMRALIQRYAENTDTPVRLNPVTATQIEQMAEWGMAAAILAEMAASTGRVLRDWFPAGAPLDHLMAGLDSTIAQPGWSPWQKSTLTAAKHIVADYVSSPRLEDSFIDQGEVRDQAEVLDAGVMMCPEVLRSARQLKDAGNR